MKIAFYLENSSIADVDLRFLEEGNPGCGGTEYLFAATPYYLASLKGDTYTPILLANHVDKLPNNLESVQVNNIIDAAKNGKKSQL